MNWYQLSEIDWVDLDEIVRVYVNTASLVLYLSNGTRLRVDKKFEELLKEQLGVMVWGKNDSSEQ